MKDKAPTLLGNYSPPNVKRGDWLFCEIRGKVQIGGYTDAPIPWPRLLKGGKPVLVLCGDLVEAVKTESVKAITYWWGVHPETVRKWRRALGVGRNTLGSRKLHQELFDSRIPDEAKERGLKTMHTPEARDKAAKSKRGKSVHPNSMKAIAKARTKPKSKAWKDKMAESMRQQWAEGQRSVPNAWTPKEIALLGTDTDEAVASRIGRTEAAVGVKRRQLGIRPLGKHQ